MLRPLGPAALLFAAFCLSPEFSLGQCVNFPQGLIPLSAVNYVTAANSAGDQLVVGSLAGALSIIAPIPLPASTNQTFCGPVELAPGQFFSNVYVPTALESQGNFSAFSGLFYDPATGLAFPNGVIPLNRLGPVFAFRIAATQVQQAVKAWSPAGSPPVSQNRNAAVRLPSGKVLVINLASGAPSYLFDPATGLWTTTGNTVFDHYSDPSATLMNDGRVLVVGGSGDSSAAEIYDPVSGKFTATGRATANHSRLHTATALNDGRVLVVGGGAVANMQSQADNATGIDSGAEVYSPKTGSFTPAGPMAVNRDGHTATLLPDGRVLIAGGAISGTLQASLAVDVASVAEAFNPATGTFTSVGFSPVGRFRHYAVLLPNGQVLIGGGFNGSASAELYDPVKNQFSFTGSMDYRGAVAQAVLLSNGQVLVAGGRDDAGNPVGTSELYNPASGTFSLTSSMNNTRVQQTMTVLLDGRVLVTGGFNGPVNGSIFAAEIYTPVTQGLVTSQTGLTFRAPQSSTAASSQSIAVLSPSGPIPWTVSMKTYAGGNWLSASPGSATSTPGGSPVSLTVRADPTGLAAQDYYGSITLTPTDQTHAPITVAIVLSVVPSGAAAPPQVSPTGLVFLTRAGFSALPQFFTVSTVSSLPTSFTATSVGTWFTYTASAGPITTSHAVNVTVSLATTTTAAGVYRGSIRLAFSDSSVQTVDLLLVVAPGAVAALRGAAATCTPTMLLPVLTSVAAGSTAPVAWPLAMSVQLVDDCGTPVNAATVTASFTNGDAPISLVGIGGGVFGGTWVPTRASTNSSVRIDARQQLPLLTGTVQVSLKVVSNPKVPVVASGGVLSSGDYASPPAAGLLVSIFGSALADGSLGFNAPPLPKQLGSTQVFLNDTQLPVVFVSDQQINVLIPYESPLNTPLQLLVSRGNAISVPVTTAVFNAQPAILATSGNGVGQGHIYRATSSGAQILASADSPATAGDYLVLYAVGLGAVSPGVTSGDAAPSSPLAQVSGVSVTIGGQPAQVQFAGLTPGYVGLYQINVVMPGGVTAGSQVPVTVSVGAKSSPSTIFMAVK